MLLLLVLLATSPASPLDAERRDVSFNKSDPNGRPEITATNNTASLLSVAKLRQKRLVQSSSFVTGDSSSLEWVTWNDSLPNDAVAFNNTYVGRTDYVCKHGCDAGFYTPSEGPYCNYPYNTKAYKGSPFEILVNTDNFEILEWKDDSYGSVPENSVRTCPEGDIYVGMNKYGLGMVSSKGKFFYLPWKDSEYWYRDYQVLTINKNIISQEIYDVKYDINDAKIFHYPPEVMRETAINNYECRSALKTDTLSKTYQVEQSWDISKSIQSGVKMTITAGVPFFSVGLEVGVEVTHQTSEGSKVIEMVTDSVSVELQAPPNHSCVVKMVRYKSKINIPFTARLSNTNKNGVTRSTSITGVYDSVQVGLVRAEVERCTFLNNSLPCIYP